MFEQIDIESLELNPFTTIGKENFLITAAANKSWNTMTGGWGYFGYMWNKPVCGVVVRPTRYTFQFMQEASQFTLSFFPPNYEQVLNICGSCSGRDCDKLSLANLSAVFVEGPDEDWVTFEQANMVFCCSMAAISPFNPKNFLLNEIEEHYPLTDYHSLYIGFIEKVLVRE
ncbi:MAG: flavin reductase [Sphaerochaetaceae bacterium]